MHKTPSHSGHLSVENNLPYLYVYVISGSTEFIPDGDTASSTEGGTMSTASELQFSSLDEFVMEMRFLLRLRRFYGNDGRHVDTMNNGRTLAVCTCGRVHFS